MHVTITAVDGDDPDGVRLRAQHEEERRRQLGGDLPQAGGVAVTSDVAVLLLARDRATGAAVACGALRPFEGGAEIKRMFVVPHRRGEGLARLVLTELERQALALGWFLLRLATGRRQPEVIELYVTAGFTRIPNFGPYVGQPESICFEKRLVAP